jgi:hypothetical protein
VKRYHQGLTHVPSARLAIIKIPAITCIQSLTDIIHLLTNSLFIYPRYIIFLILKTVSHSGIQIGIVTKLAEECVIILTEKYIAASLNSECVGHLIMDLRAEVAVFI